MKTDENTSQTTNNAPATPEVDTSATEEVILTCNYHDGKSRYNAGQRVTVAPSVAASWRELHVIK